MSSSLRNKLLIGIGGVVGLVVVALLAAPAFIDVNSYKSTIVAEVKKATGRELTIDGPISLSLLPAPTVSVTGVTFFNMPGAKNPHMVELKSVSVKPALLPLLGGNIEVSEVVLVEPKIVLEINAEGKPNWEFAPSVAEAKPAAPKPSSAKPLSLGRMVIENGTLLFSDSKAGMTMTAEKANFTASVGSFDGPYGLAGGAVVNGAPLKVDLSVGDKGGNGHAMSVSLEASGGRLGFKGTLSELGPNARLIGIATVSADQLATFVATLMGLAGQPAPALPPLLAGKFSFDGGIDASQTALAAKDFRLAIADSTGSGSLAVALKPALAIEGKVTVPKLDLDQTLAALSQPAAAPPAAKPSAPARTAAPTKQGGGGIPANMTAKLAIEVGEVIYNKGIVRNVALELDAKGGAVAVPKLTATLPGDLALQARSTMSGDPARPTVSGDFSLVGPKLRETLAWLAVDVSSMPPNKLTRLSLKGRMASTGGNVEVSNAVFELDDVKGTGGIVVTFGVPLSIVTHVELDTLDVDSFLAKPAGGQKPASSAPPPPAASAARQPQAGPSIGLKAKVAKLIYNKHTIGGVDVDVAMQGSTLKLNDIKVANFGGARFAVRGNVANYSTPTPRPDIAFNFEAPDIDGVLKVVGATPSGLGKVTASGGLAGSLEQLTLRDVNLAAMGHTVKATGTLALPGAAKGPPQSVGYKGRVVLDGQTLEGSVDARFSGKPNVTADLKSPMLDLGKLGGSGGAPAAGRGQSTAASKPIDTSGLRSVDANVKLVAATLVMPPLRFSNADLAATLKDGVLTISHFRGNLYGGSLALSGVVNGSQPTLSFDLRGDANGIYLGEMLRSTSGTNQFGSAVKVTIDGKLSATGITMKGSGSTSDQIMRSMAGGAQLSGHVFAGADKALLAIGSVATGAAGAVIDNTLGNVLGALGGNRNVASNLLSAISLVLNRFANHNSPISGHIDIAGGVLTDKGLVVQGNRATANVHTRTNLAASTTDTTANFVIAEDPSAPYLITTVRGPTSHPSFNVVRGSAKDPPGFVNTLTGSGQTQQQQQQQQRSPLPIPNLPIPNIFGR